MERLDLQAQALEDTAQAWEVLSGLLADSVEQVREIADSAVGGGGVGAGAMVGGVLSSEVWWDQVLASADQARELTGEWASDLRGVLDDMAGTEARVVADLSAVLRRTRGLR